MTFRGQFGDVSLQSALVESGPASESEGGDDDALGADEDTPRGGGEDR